MRNNCLHWHIVDKTKIIPAWQNTWKNKIDNFINLETFNLIKKHKIYD